MSIYSEPPEWNKGGEAPTQIKRDEGWAAGEKPPAAWFNWFWNRTYQSLLEIQAAFTGHRDASQAVHGLGAGESVESKEGAQAKVDAHASRTDNPHGVTAVQVGAETPAGAQAKVDLHENKTINIHGATSSPTPSRFMIRDSAGRSKVAEPSANDDIARMDTIGALVKTHHRVWIPQNHFQTNDTSWVPMSDLALSVDVPRLSNVLVTVVLAKTSTNQHAYQFSLRIDSENPVGALAESGGSPSQSIPAAFQWWFINVPAGTRVFTPLVRSTDRAGNMTVYSGYSHSISAVVTPVF